MRRQPRQQGGHNQVRIIAGDWRSRKISFPDSDALRPTPDRVRETLFNWLQFELAGRRCLDLFAGSGVLGFEAASRGASSVTMVDASQEAVSAIAHNIDELGATDIDVRQQDASAFLSTPPGEAFDLVFLDPPYQSGVLADVCQLLEQRHWLANRATIYLETDAGLAHLQALVPAGWRLIKSGDAGQVSFALYERNKAWQ